MAVAAGALVLTYDSGSDGVVAVTAGDVSASPPSTAPSTGDSSTETTAAPGATPPTLAPITDGHRPVHVSVPGIGVDAPVILLGL